MAALSLCEPAVSAPIREFQGEPLAIKELRSKLGLIQPKFAKLLHVDVETLRHWEQAA